MSNNETNPPPFISRMNRTLALPQKNLEKPKSAYRTILEKLDSLGESFKDIEGVVFKSWGGKTQKSPIVPDSHIGRVLDWSDAKSWTTKFRYKVEFGFRNYYPTCIWTRKSILITTCVNDRVSFIALPREPCDSISFPY